VVTSSLVLVLALAGYAFAPNPDRAYTDRVLKFRKDLEADLKTDEGWLSVAGLFWLDEGDNTVGTSSTSKVHLPTGSAPADVGILALNEGKVSLKVAEGVDVLVNGKQATVAELKSDATGSPDQVKINALTFRIIQRGKRIGVRLFDQKCISRTGFTGLRWFPVRPEYAIKAKFVPYNPPKMIRILNVLGDTRMSPSPGYVEFTFKSKKCRLDAESSGNGLFLNFQDLTTGDTTYGAGRFLDTPKPENGSVLVDFNEATNPPCAFTTFATCPLPPPCNRLPVAIKAGEMAYLGPGGRH